MLSATRAQSRHPNVTFHFTPTFASWLNQVEIWFGILSRKALKNASFQSIDQLRAAIEAFIEAYQPTPSPLSGARERSRARN
jgi:transposase